MKNINEIDPNITSNNLQKIAEMFLQLRKENWQNLNFKDNKYYSKPNELLEGGLKQEVNIILDRQQQEIFNSNDGCLIARFILSFASVALDEEKLALLRQLLIDKREHPVLLEINKLIKVVQNRTLKFFLHDGENYNKEYEKFAIAKINNKIANLIISTEIRRMMVDFTDRPHLPNTKSKFKFSINLTELDDKFELELRKTPTI